ncbi:hypothetical protein HYPSUDRAFT_64091 [Hypholoma sublateritium FD-334 SS-4]|uniref:Uncharacterized protein n=1 Tax=Hypholoma sublateritium (strain FD-334 SS-4) TaxID=945553 RepID=A0A0D2PCR8_HYPSF|nr:hypothetical protein HYPSUDRAFT_64091 [Hypholoma sublateritium FD-334 SS-4]
MPGVRLGGAFNDRFDRRQALPPGSLPIKHRASGLCCVAPHLASISLSIFCLVLSLLRLARLDESMLQAMQSSKSIYPGAPSPGQKYNHFRGCYWG